jgi:hypothetical protein
MEKEVAGIGEVRRANPVGIVMNAEVLLQDRDHHENSEVRFRVLVFSRVVAEFVNVPIGFSLYTFAPFLYEARRFLRLYWLGG